MTKETKQLIEYCERKEKETPQIKNGYYSKKRKMLVKLSLTF